MGSGANWRRIAKAFEDEYEVLVYDQRGHGRSFQPLSGYAPKDFAEDLREVMDELGWAKATIVGHSMGGRAALEFATLYPERLDRLAIEDIGPSMNPRAAGFLLKLLDSVPVPFSSKRAGREWFDVEFKKLYADHPKKDALAEFLYANLVEDEDKRAVWRFYEPGIRASIAQGRAQDRWAQAEALRMPTLLVRGALSQDLPREIFAETLFRNSRIEGVEIAGAGHWVHSDKPDEFIAALREFFGRHPVAPAAGPAGLRPSGLR
jgi:pimeloyl-ACP methyl ester carboxylesterase